MNELSFFDFKRKHGLSYGDIQKMTGKTLQESKDLCSGAPVPEDVARIIKAVDIVIDRIKLENGIFTDVDAQYAAKIIEELNKEIATLKAELADYKRLTDRINTDPDRIGYTLEPAKDGPHLIGSP